MRRILIDARNGQDLNWSMSPQSEDPGGWISNGVTDGEDYLRYSDLSYMGPAGSGVPLEGVRRIARYVRNDFSVLDPTVLANFWFGVFNYPLSGPWTASIPDGQDKTGKVNISVYIRPDVDVTAHIEQSFIFPSSTVVGPDVSAPAGVWTRLAHTFDTEAGGSREWNPYLIATVDGEAVPGTVILATGALFWNADETVDYFDGDYTNSWWDIHPRSDQSLGSPGAVKSVRYKVNV